MEHIALEIIEEFEKNAPTPTSTKDWEEDAELISLYLAAKRYVETHM
tara:strand:+ start:264 stop:404 length:141 start_codon:yes stop_codon:yes gene_type:complete